MLTWQHLRQYNNNTETTSTFTIPTISCLICELFVAGVNDHYYTLAPSLNSNSNFKTAMLCCLIFTINRVELS